MPEQTTPPAQSHRPDPVVMVIQVEDIVDALAEGLRDFRRAPKFGLFFGAIYALGGLAIILTASALHMSYLSYPLAAGFALVGPFIACGLYEVSRRIERNEPLTWPAILGAVWAQRGREISWMAFVVLFVTIMWMYQVRLLLALFLGFGSFSSFGAFLETVVSTPEGLMFLAVGHVVGALLSVILFSLTVISFPLLLDQDRDFITAMITSVRAVVASPVPMIGWALVVTVTLIVSMIPAFMGLLITLPVLGHTTWHIYRSCVLPDRTAVSSGGAGLQSPEPSPSSSSAPA
ncbi:DUF2189 domain-containing protein [Microvirga tunisiensis]|uniref:DUF2189 domain-containing protein n=2 Tax=Pannonibacter tanglangensis TaxID=2750084 RepID=A0ABW9ZIE8_9HYPH|nr:MULTISPECIES: DUF2189 domain-containing protein [unclassified Pannonibacter]NBN64645.1 DUF2189 domain-containing protein [Pannonibacter sp. XCT-34]NBN79180.1 DUF2189 domain-containing protein [Pannonibacter sp. XCT-53]